MKPHPTIEEIRRWKRGELSPDDVITVGRHLAECSACTSSWQSDAALDGSIGAIVEQLDDEHPDLETELFVYADGSLPASRRTQIEQHLEICRRCREDVGDLVVAPHRASRTMPRWIIPAAIAATVILAVGVMLNARRETMPVTQPPGTVSTQASPVERPERSPYANARWETLVAEALASGRLPFPSDLAALRGPKDALRGGDGGSPPRLSPAGIVIDETRPRFSWPSIPNATYVVSIYDGDNDDRVAQSEPLRRTNWIPSRDLPRGRTMIWQVNAMHDGVVDSMPAPPAPQAKFRIAGEHEHADLAEAKRRHPDDPLLLAVLNARAGLRDEALRELHRVDVAKHPDVKRLIDQSDELGDPTSTEADQ